MYSIPSKDNQHIKLTQKIKYVVLSDICYPRKYYRVVTSKKYDVLVKLEDYNKLDWGILTWEENGKKER